MRIGLNLLYLIPGRVGGTEVYARGLIHELVALDRENQYHVFVNREAAHLELPVAPNLERTVCGVNAVRRSRRYAWEQLVLPFQVRRRRLDLLHSLGYVCPLVLGCPSVVTIHDANYIGLRGAVALHTRILRRLFFTQAARGANHVITDSGASKREIVASMGLAPEKVSVIHLGCRPWDPTAAPAHARRHALDKPYIFAFSSPSRHKNIGRLIAAFTQIADRFPHDLVLAGHPPPATDLAPLDRTPGQRQRVRLLGFVGDNEVMPLLAGADLFVFPSWYEGFGLPILEAQSAGVAIACSTAGSLPEVAGGAALLFDPESTDAMAEAMARLLAEPALRHEQIARGRENARRFSWRKTASETLAVYENVLRAAGRRPA